MKKRETLTLSDGFEGRGLSRKHILFLIVVVAWVAADVATKAWAEHQLVPQHLPHNVFGSFVRFTLVYNQGAAFGMRVGEWSRWVFSGLTVGALIMLGYMLRETRKSDVLRTLALALVTAGALGNLVDRMRSARGVIDFIDVGTSQWRFWTFNVADVGVSCGAVLLALVLWHEERTRRPASSAAHELSPEAPATHTPARQP